MTMLRLETVGRKFGNVEAVHDLSLAIAPRGLHVVAGPSGAGKSTLCSLVSGRLRPDSGRILFDDTPITRLSLPGRARLGIIAGSRGDAVFPSRTVFETLLLAHEAAHRRSGRLSLGVPETAELAAYRAMRDAGLGPQAHERAADLDRDQCVILEIACALAADARLIVLDEPLKGAGPALRDRMLELLAALKRSRAILLSTHSLEPVLPVADWAIVLAAGRTIATGAPADLAQRPIVRTAYVGDEVEHA
jgi:branched-chain amino acid transport system ATP-binding protein